MAKRPFVTFKVEGLKESIARLEELPKATRRNVTKKVALGMLEPIEGRMVELAPEETGTLVRSIDKSHKARGKKKPRARRKAGQWRVPAASYITAHLGPTGASPNPLFQEFGTVNMPPNAFARPAFDERAGQAIEVAGQLFRVHIGKAIERMEKKAARAKAKAAKVR